MQVKNFIVGSGSYNVVRATAVQQDEILSLLTQSIVTRLAASENGNPDDSTFIVMFAALPYNLKRKIDGLLLSNVTDAETKVKVTSSDFQGRMIELNQLRTEVLKWNFEDFFTFWASEVEKERQKTQAQAKAV